VSKETRSVSKETYCSVKRDLRSFMTSSSLTPMEGE
jgi:hypothetical protein